MPANKRKKKSRRRGSQTHGWGAKKKHRGKGHKGGSGKSGCGKRTNPKEPSIWKDTKYFGKYGFVNKNVKLIIRPLNIKRLDENIDELVKKNLAKKEKDAYVINLEQIGFNKLLGSGRVSKKLRITTQYASKNAVEAVKGVGGDVTLIREERKEKEKQEEKKKVGKIGKKEEKEKEKKVEKEEKRKEEEIKEERKGEKIEEKRKEELTEKEEQKEGLKKVSKENNNSEAE